MTASKHKAERIDLKALVGNDREFLRQLKVDGDCLQELRWLYARRDLAEALDDLATWLARWGGGQVFRSPPGLRRTLKRR
jgi:hypothetical protein